MTRGASRKQAPRSHPSPRQRSKPCTAACPQSRGQGGRPAVSHHLKVLRTAGVLESQKVGKEVYFWVNKAFLESSLGAVLDYLRSHA